MHSIRKRLLIHLLLVIGIAWLLDILYTIYEAKHEIEELFDAQLAQATGVIDELTHENLNVGPGVRERTLSKSVYGHKYERKVSFQIWDGDTLLLRSRSAPSRRLAPTLGFSDAEHEGKIWRIFGLYSESSQRTIYVGEGYLVRDELISYVTMAAAYPMLIVLPVLALLIWLSIGRGLAPLKKITDEVRRRSPNQLDPVSLNGTPLEVSPLIVALNTLLARLRAAFDKERRFTADAAHELRTPLASIKTQAQVALRSPDENERREILAKIITGVDRGAHLVEQMLTLARLEPDAEAHYNDDIDLLAVARHVAGELVTQAETKHIELSLDADESLAYHIRGYRAGIGILVRNLVDNALRYTPQGGRVTISLGTSANDNTLLVEDSGPGIPANERTRVFDRFYRPPGHDDFGCGLGLSIVQHLAILHHATIELSDSTLGGLAFKVVFPK